jgi:hypothetical protein
MEPARHDDHSGSYLDCGGDGKRSCIPACDLPENAEDHWSKGKHCLIDGRNQRHDAGYVGLRELVLGDERRQRQQAAYA